MRLNKFVATLAITATVVGFAAAQSATLSIHLGQYDAGQGFDDVSVLSALPAGAPSTLNFDLSDFGTESFLYVQVTTRVRASNHTGSLGISIINSYINLNGTGLTVAEFDADEGGNDGDDRKNANSHPRGNGAIDGAGNGTYRNNSARWYDPTAPGDPISGPAAFGKSIYTSPFTGTTSQPLYSFVVVVPKQVGTYNINFTRPFGGSPANTDPTAKTNILANSPQGRPVQYQLETINGTITVVPEPASMIALGSGLVGLLALRRRRAN
ncbi:MAG: hypothetical protein KatS3mg019_1674 [Fimbriimonadales bacterium]|nr:MAG: hypothetical protein KatS3mg019_1674 [Fimbriimonadales bacterium]